ncbi:MAG: hypothetical protein D6689_20905 [Deltaproteobacteria bacterium]|nr:MAG: hypothetical protein D6689_20905 [Deltaproteobacteria bacterium]
MARPAAPRPGTRPAAPRRRAIARFAAIAATAAAACAGDGAPATPLAVTDLVAGEPAPAPIDVAAAARDPAELLRALTQPHRRVAAALGGHRFRGTSSVVVSADGDEVERLSDETSIDYRDAGAFAARLDNSRDYGRHVVFVGGELYLRPRYGKYHRRPPVDRDEPARILDDIYATFGDTFALVAPAVDPVDRGPVTVAGRPARRIELARAARPRPRHEDDPARAWRETIVVDHVDGYAVVDDATGAVLDGRIAARLAFSRDGRPFDMEVAAAHQVEPGAPDAIAPPPADQTVTTHQRSHELDDRDALLDGLAPRKRRGPAPK